MTIYRLTDEELEKIIEAARFAPSVHNTQPWHVRNKQGSIEVTIDQKYRLGPGDPTGRQTIISLGILTEAICLVAGTFGLSASAKFDQDRVNITFQQGAKIKNNILNLLRKRATDRSIYKKVPVASALKSNLKKIPENKSSTIWIVEDENLIQSIAKLTSQGISLALSNPKFREELRKYLLRQGSRRKRGISVKSLYIPSVIAALQPDMLKIGLNTGKEAGLEKKRWLSASAIVLITTDGDLHDDWFEAGRVYIRASLEIEKSGLSQATSAATVEAATFHEDIEKLLGTNQRLQAVIRIGSGVSKRKYSPRVSAKELITSN